MMKVGIDDLVADDFSGPEDKEEEEDMEDEEIEPRNWIWDGEQLNAEIDWPRIRREVVNELRRALRASGVVSRYNYSLGTEGTAGNEDTPNL